MKTLAIDYGTRRVGLAISDDGGTFVFPLDVVLVSKPEQARDEILRVIKSEGVQQLVVGLPLNMDGTIGAQAKTTAQWAADLSKAAGLPVIFVDERLSSFSAEQGLIERQRGGEKMTRKKKKSILDAHAAAGFLREFLDGKLQPIIPEG